MVSHINDEDDLVDEEHDTKCKKLRNALQRAWENYNDADNEEDRKMYWRSITIAERRLDDAGC